MLLGVLIALLFGLSIAILIRYEKARKFNLKVKRLCNKIISETLVDSKAKEGKELEDYLDKYNYFMRCLYRYNLISYLFSTRKLKLHEWFDRKLIDEVNKLKANSKKQEEDNIIQLYDKMAKL